MSSLKIGELQESRATAERAGLGAKSTADINSAVASEIHSIFPEPIFDRFSHY
jgi:hypothetical protein